MTPFSNNRTYEFFIVILTKQGKLVDAHVRGTSIAHALDKMIDQLDLAGQVLDYKFCVRREL